jgi:hypothetical protein
MINKPNVKSEAEFWEWYATWPVNLSVGKVDFGGEHQRFDQVVAESWEDDPAALHLCFGYKHYKESDWPHAAWSDLADSIYFAIKRLDYFDVRWRVKPEIDASVSFTDHRMVRQSYVRLTVVPRERPSVSEESAKALFDGWFSAIKNEADGLGVTLASNSEYEYLNVPQTFTGIPTLPKPQKIEWSQVADPSNWAIGVDPAVTYPEKFYWMGPNGLEVTDGGYVAQPIMPLPYRGIGGRTMDFMSAVDQIRDSLTLSTAPMLPGPSSDSVVYTQAYVDQAERVYNEQMNRLRASLGIEPLPESRK